MTTYTEAQLSALKLAEVTAIYNEMAEKVETKPVKKFRDKPTAIARTLDIQTKLPEEKPEVTLTDKEHVALMAIAQNGLDQMCGNEPTDLLEDNCSYFDLSEMVTITGMSKHQCSGLMSALDEKGLILDTEEGINGEGPDQWVMTDEGIKVAQSIWYLPLPEIKKEAKKSAGKGNSKTDMNAKVEIVKQRNSKEGSIGEMMFNHIAENTGITVQELVDFMVANYEKPRSNVPITQGFVVNTIRYFVREGSLKFA